MWSTKYLTRIDFRVLPILLGLMIISLVVVSATTVPFVEEGFFTPQSKAQLQWFGVGWAAYLFFAGFDYRKLREFSWIFYVIIVILLIGVFFVPSIQNVHRWYRLSFIKMSLQPSDYAKLAIVLCLSWFLEKKERTLDSMSTSLYALLIVLIPFILIVKQPDLGSALVLLPTCLVLFYIGGLKRRFVSTMTGIGAVSIGCVVLLFLGIVPHEKLRPYTTGVLKEYQFERLNPETYHQKASQTALAIGGMGGSGWRKSEFTGRMWLPEAHTDSIFAAYGEEFGLIGVAILLALFFGLIYYSLRVSLAANDRFGKLLSAGIVAYIAVHLIVNMGMMCGFFPITGVPLLLVSYGGSSLLSTMSALGILQSIYSRRYTF